MQTKKFPMFPVSLSVSIFFHGLFIMLVSLKIFPVPESPVLKEPERFLSLIDISLIEPPQPEEQPVLSVPATIPVTVLDAGPVEDFIVVEEVPELSDNMESIDETLFLDTAISTAADAQKPAVSTEKGTDADAPVAEYIRRNYNYIQRRIRDKLVYPPQARRAGYQGITELRFIIHENGSVSDITVRGSSGYAILDEGAVAAIFAAAPFPKPPAKARIAIPVSFKLR